MIPGRNGLKRFGSTFTHLRVSLYGPPSSRDCGGDGDMRRRHRWLNIGAISRRLSGPVHFALYALMFITPIVGIVTFVYHGRAFDFGLFRIDFGIRSNRSVFHPTEDWHGYLAYALFGLAGFHALTALWHQFVLRDGLLSRMWPRV